MSAPPRYAVRITYGPADLDGGQLSRDALRRTLRDLAGVPGDVQIIVELGPCRQLQDQLVCDLAQLGPTARVSFSSPSWQVAREHVHALERSTGPRQ